MTKRKSAAGPSKSVEDFLKAVYTLGRSGGRVSTNALADALGVSAPAVTDMAQRLVDEGSVDYRKYRGVLLTDAGERVALKILRRHRLIETYLVHDLGYELREIHDEAEALEHTVSDRFIEAIARKLGHPRYDPHGDPIPTLDGSVPHRDLQPLAQLALGEPARICRYLMDDPDMLQETQTRGLVMGEEVQVVERDAFEGPLTLLLDADRRLVIGHKMASEILVDSLTPS